MIDQVRPRDLAAWFRQDPQADAVLLDVREPGELQAASVTPDGFRLVSIPMSGMPAGLEALQPDQRVACLCHHGARSQRVAMYLQQNGFDTIANVTGGIDAWSVEVDPAIPRY